MAARGREIELKLGLSDEGARQVASHPRLRALALGPPRLAVLHSVYFDTRGLALRHAGIGLRLRDGAGARVQTLKTGEREVGALFERGEHECRVEGDAPDLSAVSDAALRAKLLELTGDEPLERVFETHMTRTSWRLSQGPDVFCADLDQGEIRAARARAPICELELELEQGDAACLFEFALSLLDSISLQLGTASKAERGYALAAGEASGPPQCVPRPREDAPEPERGAPALRGCLGRIARALARALAAPDSRAVARLCAALAAARQALAVPAAGAPSGSAAALRQALAALEGELRHARGGAALVGVLHGRRFTRLFLELGCLAERGARPRSDAGT